MGTYYRNGSHQETIRYNLLRSDYRRRNKTLISLRSYWCGTSGGITISGRPLVHPEVDYTPHYGIDKNIGIGTTGIQISGEIEDPIRTFSHVGLGTLFTATGAAESVTWDPPVGTVLYDFSGTGLEALSAQTPERTVNVVISGVGTDEKFTVREVGVASTITLTGTLVERQTDDYVGSGIATISGDAETRQIGVFGYYGDDRDPGTSGIITVFGELNHPDIDYTPHYGIDKNIGIGTTGILFSIGPAGFDILEIQLVEDTTHQFTQVMLVELKDLVVLVLELSDLMMIKVLQLPGPITILW